MKLRPWLELTRISNVPTVWSNVIHGMGAAWFVQVVRPVRDGYMQPFPIGWPDLGRFLDAGFPLLIGMSLLYGGGMVLNDVCDSVIDREERPQRPIPSGRVGRRAAAGLAGGLLLAGWLCTMVYAPPVVWIAFGLILSITAYNLWHRIRVIGLLLMPLCRGLLVLTAAATVRSGVSDGTLVSPLILCSALSVAGYTLAITLAAWHEARPGLQWIGPWIGVLIAAMPLIDATYLLAFGLWPLAVFCFGCFALSVAGQRWIRGS